MLAFAATAALLLSSTAYSSPVQPIDRRNYIDPTQIAASYDFVIAGGGLAGLVLAARLSEDASTTVLVLEAGDNGDLVRDRIDVPTNTYFDSLLMTSYDWNYVTQPQPGLGGRNTTWPRGKVLGGSSAVNGMYMVRPSALEINTIAAMQGSQTGAAAWNWSNLLTVMKLSETFTPPEATVQTEANIVYNADSHGTQGPIHTTYPGFELSVVGDYITSLNNIGLPTSQDPNNGNGWGAFVATSAMNPANWTRSYSKSAYIDPLPPRSNLHILVNQTATRINFGGNGSNGLTAVSVEYANNGFQTKPWPTVGVTKEVILAAGAVGSPNILQQSGVGPSDKLQAAGVPVVLSLPGVGQHVQDHISTQVIWKANGETSALMHTAGQMNPLANGTVNPAQSFINSAIAYTNITDLLGSDADAFQQELAANLTAFSSNPAYQPSSDPTVKAGYEAIYNATLQIMLSKVGQVEILLGLTGTSAGGDGSIAVQAALQHPFSQGEIYIATPNPFDYPIINPNYFSHPADIVLLREGIKLARTVGTTTPLSSSCGAEVSPGAATQTDDQWATYLTSSVATEYHPSCSCAMLPLELGGVVDPQLKVHGLANVRVADSSVWPMEFAAHMMAPTYGLAEQAALIIKAQYNGTPAPGVSSTSSAPATTASSQTTKNSKKSGALPQLHSSSVLLATAMAAVCALLL